MEFLSKRWRYRDSIMVELIAAGKGEDEKARRIDRVEREFSE